jgi:ribosomal protein S18 acetylase RimI-like enzyme
VVRDPLLIRPATADDEAFARECHHRALHDVVTRQFGPWNDALQDGFFDGWWRQGRAQIVEVDGVASGYIDVLDRDDHVVVNELVLLPEVHGRGIGTELLTDVFALGKPVRLLVLHENHRARALYERLGFVAVDRDSTHDLMRRDASPAGSSSLRPST